MASYILEETPALVITYGILLLCALVASISIPFIYKEMNEKLNGEDFWYSARNSQGWISLGLSFFASSMGAWVLFAAPEVGAIQSWWGVLGYACASSFPFLLISILGPMVRSRFDQGFCVTDWVGQRFGRTMQILVALVSLFYMWVYLVAELTSMGNLVRDFAGLDPLNALLPVSLVTMLYTMAGGLPASIWTDRLQGVIMAIAIIVTIIACVTGLEIKESAWKKASVWSDKGFESFITLILAILGAELFNMGNWQRVYAAKDTTNLRKGLVFGAAMIFPTMMLFGLVGILAEAQDQSRAQPSLVIKALAFFDLLGGQPTWVAYLAFALGISMVASSVDSLQTGLLSVISQEITKLQWSPLALTCLGQVFVLMVNIPAIIFAYEATKDVMLGLDVINLFLVADLLTLSIAVPVFLGLGSLATQNGALAGCFAGFITIMGFGWFEFGTFMAGLEMFTLMAFGNVEPLEYGLGASRTCIIFFVLPIITACVTITVSWCERVLEYLGAFTNLGAKNETQETLAPKNETQETLVPTQKQAAI
jgi:Na+/proline symporter